jgi:hypothetical protein
MSIRNSLIAGALLLLTVASLHADGIENNAITNGVYGGMISGKFVGTTPVVSPAAVVAVIVGGFP